MIPDVPIYTPMQLEQMAHDTLRRRSDVPFAPPIKIERLLTNLPDLSIQYEYGLDNEHGIEGCICKQFMCKTLTVFIDRRIMEGEYAKYNRVLGEEFAHIVIHPSMFTDINSVEQFVEHQSHPMWARWESDARRFSGAIRMPPSLVVEELGKAYGQIVDDVGFGNAAVIENRIKMRLAELFRVSPEEIWRRLVEPPCSLRDSLLNSIQSRNSTLLPTEWTVKAIPPMAQQSLFRRSERDDR